MRMKWLLASAALASLPINIAGAADMATRMPTKAPMLAPVPFTWTGFYVGATVGAAWARSSVDNDPSGPGWLLGPVDANKTSVIGGLEVGYNYQISSIVLGVEGDVSFTSLDRSVAVANLSGLPDTYNSRLTVLGTLRGRIGLAFDRVLVYGTGGVAFSNLRDSLSDTIFGFTASTGSNETGWTAGGGVEYAFADHWSAKAEYLHVGFSDRSVNSGFPSNYQFKFKDSLDIARVGINYKF